MKQRDYISLTSGRMVLLLLFIIHNIICVMHSYPLTNPDYCKMKLPTVLTELGTKMMVVVINMVSPNSEWGSAATVNDPPPPWVDWLSPPVWSHTSLPSSTQTNLLKHLSMKVLRSVGWSACGNDAHTTMLENSLDWSRQNSGRFFSFFGKLELREEKKKSFVRHKANTTEIEVAFWWVRGTW